MERDVNQTESFIRVVQMSMGQVETQRRIQVLPASNHERACLSVLRAHNALS